jgi:N-acetylglucosamine-6-sulfatase
MLAVDESVGEIVETLERTGKIDNTVVIYYSDNGYLMGEQGLIDKRVMHEPSIRVPAFIHWPAILQNPASRTEFILNIDLGPTILDIADLETPSTMHGRSFLPLVTDADQNWRQSFVYEYFVDPNAVQTPTIFGLRTSDYSYMTTHGVWDIHELYDMRNDEDQRTNLLGGITYGNDYGTFLRHVQAQDPDLYEIVKPLDDQLTERLEELDGSRTPVWSK